MLSKDTQYRALLLLTLLAAFGGLLTLVPWPGASQFNILGYLSLCTFTPAASFFCFAIAALSCTFRAAYASPTARAKGSQTRGLLKHKIGLLVSGFLILLGLIFSMIFLGQADTYAGLINKTKFPTSTSLNQEEPAFHSAPTLRDGTFRGKASEVDLSVEIELLVQTGKITDIRILKSKSFTSSVLKDLEEQSLVSQGPALDGISGATASSTIWNLALEKALEQAKIVK